MGSVIKYYTYGRSGIIPCDIYFRGYFYRSLRIQTRQNNYLAGIWMQLLRGSGIHADNSTSASGILAEPGGVCNSAWYDTESSACFFCGISVRRIFQFNDPLQTQSQNGRPEIVGAHDSLDACGRRF